jgi:uncharacterized UPF0160 family protein
MNPTFNTIVIELFILKQMARDMSYKDFARILDMNTTLVKNWFEKATMPAWAFNYLQTYFAQQIADDNTHIYTTIKNKDYQDWLSIVESYAILKDEFISFLSSCSYTVLGRKPKASTVGQFSHLESLYDIFILEKAKG